jgi:serine/threonine protein kinase
MAFSIAQLEVSPDDYIIDTAKPLSQDFFSTVYRAVHKATKREVAVKSLSCAVDADDEPAFLRELAILGATHHPAVLRLLGFSFASGELGREHGGCGPILITPIMPNGTMGDAIRRARTSTASPAWNATAQSKCVFGTAAGMAHMHSHQFRHSDLHADVILLDDKYEPAITDFGILARCDDGVAFSQGTLRSPLTMAPEVGLGAAVPDVKADVYSFAMLVYLMFSPSDLPRLEGGKPCKSAHLLRLQAARGARFERLPNIPDYYWDVITRCWSAEPGSRPSFQDLVDEFRSRHEYVLAGADLGEITRYEDEVTAGLVHGDGAFTQPLE